MANIGYPKKRPRTPLALSGVRGLLFAVSSMKMAVKDMNPVENWFYILRNCRNFAHKPEGMDPRYDHIIEAAKTNLVPDKERTQYLRAMLSDYDKKDIADAYFEDGYEKGMEANRLETAKKMLEKSLDMQLISECTGLSLEQVEALKG